MNMLTTLPTMSYVTPDGQEVTHVSFIMPDRSFAGVPVVTPGQPKQLEFSFDEIINPQLKALAHGY